jgi:uncharacterized membrane protein SirB2
MLVALILGVIAVVALGVMLMRRKQSRKPTHDIYFSQTLGISDPAPVPAKAEDESPRLL